MVVLKDEDAYKAFLDSSDIDFVQRLDEGLSTIAVGRWYYPNRPGCPFVNTYEWHGSPTTAFDAQLTIDECDLSPTPLFRPRGFSLGRSADQYLTSRTNTPFDMSIDDCDAEEANAAQFFEELLSRRDLLTPQDYANVADNDDEAVDATESLVIGGQDTVRKLNFGSDILGGNTNTARCLDFLSQEQMPSTLTNLEPISTVMGTLQNLESTSTANNQDHPAIERDIAAAALRDRLMLRSHQAPKQTLAAPIPTQEQLDADFEDFINQNMVEDSIEWIEDEFEDEIRRENIAKDWAPLWRAMWKQADEKLPIPDLATVQNHSYEQSMKSIFGDKLK